MKKIFLIIAVFAGLLLVNIFDVMGFLDNMLGNNAFEDKIYDKALHYYKKSSDINNTKEALYNQGNAYYKLGNYSKAAGVFNSLSGDEVLGFDSNHNLGNTLYRLGENEASNETKKSYRENAVKSYETALNIRSDEETKKNLEFVLNKLKQLDQSSKDSSKDRSQSVSTGDSKSSKSDEGTGSGNSKDSSKDSSKDAINRVSTDEFMKQVENYAETLKDEEAQNQQFFNKKPQAQDNNGDIFQQIFGKDPFDNSDLQSKEKDR